MAYPDIKSNVTDTPGDAVAKENQTSEQLADGTKPNDGGGGDSSDSNKKVGTENSGGATVVVAPTHLNMTAGSMAYDRSYDAEEFPDLSGANSMFNNFSTFKYALIGDIASTGTYNRYAHFDHGMTEAKSDTFNKDFTEGKNIEKWEDIRKLYYNTYSFDSNNFTRLNFIDQSAASGDDRPTAKRIIEASANASENPSTYRMPYSWNDFLYCKWYGKIPNNRLITLRRYPFPVDDLATNHENELLIPMAQAVTYFGEGTGNSLTNLLKMQWGLEWKEVESKVQDVDGNEKGWGSGAEGPFSGAKFTAIAGAVGAFARGAGIKGTDANSRWDGSGKVANNWLKNAYTDEGAYWNQVLGPVNVVHKSHRRDRGFKWQNNLAIKFTFSLRSYYGVNPRIAALDIMTNMLRLTSNNGKWWGGATRYFPNMQHQVKFLGDQEKFYNMEWEDYFKSVRSELSEMGKNLSNKFKDIQPPDFASLKLGDLKGFLESLKKTASDFMGQIGNQAISMAMGKLAAATRPELLSIRSLLEGRPVGEWHLTIGNPLNPIAVMGNMLVDSCDFEVGETLGADDFPNELTFTVNLKHARPREIGDTESIFNIGMGRMSYTPLTATSSEVNTFGSAFGDHTSDKTKYYSIQKAQNTKLSTSKDMARDEITAADYESNDKVKLYMNLKSTNMKNIKEKVKINYGTAWGDSTYLLRMIDKTKLKI